MTEIFDPCMTRTVEPRKPAKPCTRPVLALDAVRGIVLTEHGGSVSLDEYARRLPYLPPHIIVCFSPETFLYTLHERWSEHPRWSWRVAVTTPHGSNVQRKRVAYYGFRAPKGKRRANHYHIVLDAGSFTRKQDPITRNLLALGLTVRDFCNAHGLEVRASAAGIAVQLLRHPRFYPFARRRVPHWLNGQVQPHLPGGYYHSYADTAQRMDAALHIDQESAYHYAAQTTPLPSANSVRAIGYGSGPKTGKRYARPGGTLYKRELTKHGLIKAAAVVPHLHPQDEPFAPPVMRLPGHRVVHVWTNELPYLQSLGLQVTHLIAMWGTEEIDHGLAKYAQWARAVGKQYPQLKALLLMPYGLLARRRATVTCAHPGGHDTLILANQMLDDVHTYEVTMHPEVANTLQLGLVQAFVRALSLDMARQVHNDGHELLSIYADGLFVRVAADKSLPLFTPWRVKEVALDATNTQVPARHTVRRRYQPVTTQERKHATA